MRHEPNSFSPPGPATTHTQAHTHTHSTMSDTPTTPTTHVPWAAPARRGVARTVPDEAAAARPQLASRAPFAPTDVATHKVSVDGCTKCVK